MSEPDTCDSLIRELKRVARQLGEAGQRVGEARMEYDDLREKLVDIALRLNKVAPVVPRAFPPPAVNAPLPTNTDVGP